MPSYSNIIFFGDSGVGKSFICDFLVEKFGYNKLHLAFYVRKFLYKKLLDIDLKPNSFINKNYENKIVYNNKTIQNLLIDSVEIIHFNNPAIQHLYNCLNLLTIYLNNFTVIPGLRLENHYDLLNNKFHFNFINIKIVNDNNKKEIEKYDKLELLNYIDYIELNNSNLLNEQELESFFNNIFTNYNQEDIKDNNLIKIINYLPDDVNFSSSLHDIKIELEDRLNQYLEKELLNN